MIWYDDDVDDITESMTKKKEIRKPQQKLRERAKERKKKQLSTLIWEIMLLQDSQLILLQVAIFQSFSSSRKTNHQTKDSMLKDGSS